jgi:hypothetical protein
MSQQKPSAAQTSSQQAASLQARPVCALQQSPAIGFPQVPAHPAHRASAVVAQVASQPDSQQNGSSMHTVRQHEASEHDGVACAVQQSPLEACPQPGPQIPQTCLAVAAQVLSHDWMQQTGSTTHSERQQRSSAHPGVACAVQQSPPAGPPHAPAQSPQRITAASAHDWSHEVSQQKPSSEQIASQQSASEHDGVVRAVQQLPALGSPQPMPHTPQICCAASAHDWSHCALQQNASATHTALQQVASSQSGPWCGTQHAPVIGLPHSSPQVPQYSTAVAAHDASHSTSQQKLSAAQIGTQHAGSEQAGVGCASQQSPAAGSPQPTPHTPHTSCAICAHCRSHCTAQQNESTVHTPWQQSALLQPRSCCGTQQSPASGSPHGSAQAPHEASAAAAQYWSHCMSQQNESCAQMSVQQGASEHAGVVFAAQQLPADGLPQPTPQTPQFACAREAHIASQRVLQQNGSIAQTSWQQETFLQPRPVFAKQQLL